MRDNGRDSRSEGGEWALDLVGVTRRHGRGARAVHALRGVDVRLARGSFTAVMGPSGSGKSTLLQCAAGLDRPTGGSVRLGGTEIGAMGERRLTRLRRDRVGFVFQSFNLLPTLTVEQNVLLPVRLAGGARDRERARRLLARVGLADRARSRPGELSGGQRQRAAIARALITDPEVVCADEPTGALDPATAEDVLALLRGAVAELGATVLMVTHDPAAAAWADRVLFLADGLVVEEVRPDAVGVAGIAGRMRALGGARPGARLGTTGVRGAGVAG
ncbi:ABC transporter ATP-binding protein [Streptomyces sp. NPDC003077]|uniref:ABC transporter ATP-binding protein n=1 Tax=Streptomyces sp. NPDC003077 TaxID=3154443 RepID=UPI0033A37C4A